MSKAKVGQEEPNPSSITQTLLMSSNEDSEEYDRLRRLLKYIFGFGTLFGLLTVTLLIINSIKYGKSLSWSTPGGLFGFHVLFMTIFMFYVHGQASVVFRVLPSVFSKNMVKYIHAGIHGVVCIGVSVGLAAIVQNYDARGKKHFFSLHTWIGIGAIGLYYLQFLFGFFTYLLPLPFIPWSFRTRVLPIHIYLGQCIFSFTSVSMITGLMMLITGGLGLSKDKMQDPLVIQNIAGLMIILYTLLTGDILLDNRFRRRPRPPSEGDDLMSVNTGGRHGSRVANYMDADTDGEVWTDHLNAP